MDATRESCAIDVQSVVQLLSESALVIASFRNRLKSAGYPFAEPQEAARIITEIDNLVEPLLAVTDNKTSQITKVLPSIPVFIKR